MGLQKVKDINFKIIQLKQGLGEERRFRLSSYLGSRVIIVDSVIKNIYLSNLIKQKNKGWNTLIGG